MSNPLAGSTVLVTGGAGYIGSHMVWKLVDQGERVLVADRLSTGFEWAVAPEAALARGERDVPAMGGWRKAIVGEKLLAAL